MKTFLDWSTYKHAGLGDAYADIPPHGGDFARSIAVCINSRVCESDGRQVMCPSFQVTGNPALSPGGRVRLLKAALSSDLVETAMDDPVLAEAMDLCVACKGCKRECEANVDMALIKAEYLAQRRARHGGSLRGWVLTRWPRWLDRWPMLHRVIAWRNRSRALAWLGQSLLGLSARRCWPETRQVEAPGRRATPQDAAGELPEVVLWVDTFCRLFEPDIAAAAHDVLTAAGYPVMVAGPAVDDDERGRALCCGRTALAQGRVDAARREAARVVAALEPHLDAGRVVVGLEASCVLGLRDDAQALGLGEAMARVGGAVMLFEEFLAREIMAKRLQLPMTGNGGRRVLVHGHCHQKAVGAMKAVRRVLKRIPGLDFAMIEAGCCGMAGTFGLEAEHADLSIRMAERQLMPALRAEPAADVIANGFSCRQQVRDLGDARPRHLAQLLRDCLLPEETR
ncbi:MAG: (Fe-S)-binding protein [Gammaproteobacteria bacterium]|nr:(Fe-S)-binding protein [Gammaproteobacteria bacterium]